MNWVAVARKDYDQVRRSRLALALSAAFVLAAASLVVAYGQVAARPTADTALLYVVALSKWLVPVLGLVAGYDAVVDERERGTLRLLFGFPVARRDVLLGKLAGRLAAVWTALAAGFFAAGVMTVAVYRTLPVASFLALVVLAGVLGLVFVALGVAISAVSGTTAHAVAGVFATFVVALFLWDLLPAGVYFLATGSVPGATAPPAWYVLLERLNPVTGFLALVTAAFPNLSEGLSGDAPAYLSPVATALVLGAWLVLPIGASFAVFRRADLA